MLTLLKSGRSVCPILGSICCYKENLFANPVAELLHGPLIAADADAVPVAIVQMLLKLLAQFLVLLLHAYTVMCHWYFTDQTIVWSM